MTMDSLVGMGGNGHSSQWQANKSPLAMTTTNEEMWEKKAVSTANSEKNLNITNCHSNGASSFVGGLMLIQPDQVNEDTDVILGQPFKEGSVYSEKIASWADYYHWTKPILKKNVVRAIVTELKTEAGCRFVGPVDALTKNVLCRQRFPGNFNRADGDQSVFFCHITDEKKIHLRIMRDLVKCKRLQKEKKETGVASVSLLSIAKAAHNQQKQPSSSFQQLPPHPPCIAPPVEQVDIPDWMFDGVAGNSTHHDDLSSIHEVSILDEPQASCSGTTSVATTTLEDSSSSHSSSAGSSVTSSSKASPKAKNAEGYNHDHYYHDHKAYLEEPLDICGNDVTPVELLAMPHLLHDVTSCDSWDLHGLDFLDEHDKQHHHQQHVEVVSYTTVVKTNHLPAKDATIPTATTDKTTAPVDQDEPKQDAAAAAAIAQEAKVHCPKKTAAKPPIASRSKQGPTTAAPTASKNNVVAFSAWTPKPASSKRPAASTAAKSPPRKKKKQQPPQRWTPTNLVPIAPREFPKIPPPPPMYATAGTATAATTTTTMGNKRSLTRSKNLRQQPTMTAANASVALIEHLGNRLLELEQRLRSLESENQFLVQRLGQLESEEQDGAEAAVTAADLLDW